MPVRARGVQRLAFRCLPRLGTSATITEPLSSIYHCDVEAAGWRAPTPLRQASVKHDLANPASTMKASENTFDRSMMVVARDLQTVADPDTAGAAFFIQRDVNRRLGEPWRWSETDLVAP